MKIAFTHNLKTSVCEEQAEFDTAATVVALTEAIRANGHEVVPVEVTGSLAELVATLKSVQPDLIFNTAEGTRGRCREALYPAVFDELGIPYTGSDAHCLTVTLDKYLTNMVVERAGVRIPRSAFRTPGDDAGLTYPCPCIVKPNYEGSSKGITDASVVQDPRELNATVARALEAYPDGLIVEEYIPGTDVTIGFLEGLGSELLTPCSYEYAPGHATKFRIYDYSLKNHHTDPEEIMTIACPARVSPKAVAEIKTFARRAIRALNLRNVCRLDFRVRDDGTVFFIEANANPSFEVGASIFDAAKRDHDLSYTGVIGHIISQAATRWADVGGSTERLEAARKAWMAG